uniref:Uncharacterized protein n=1 Tax=Compsopogon caeruleus TaxID=31354 RepID=A0A7S1TEY2_9RHOD
MDSILNHANQLVKVLAGLSFSAEEEYTTLSIAYLGLVISKNILKWTTSPTYSVGLQQLLTELLKLTSSAPRTAEDGKFFLDILDAWLLIIDSVQDRMSEGSTNAAATVAYLEQGLAAVAQACVELSLYMSNGKMLHRMEDWDSFELDLDKKLSQESDVVYETDGFFRVETEESCLSDRADLIEKCIQVASGISQLYSQSVASSLGQFLRERLRSFNRMCPEDGRTILSMTAQVGATLPASSDIARLLFQDVSELATQWNVRDLLSSSLFHILNAMLSVLENAPSDVSLSFAERLAKRAVEVILDPECMTTTRVSAASFLAKLADRFRRSVLLLGLAIPASFVRDCKQPRVARSLLVALMYTRLLGNPEASQEEWLQRIEDFRSCLDEILGRYNEVVRSNKLVVSGQEDEAALLEIVRASGLCRALYDTMMGEKASSRDALWESSKKHMQQDGVRALKIVGVLGEGIPAFAILRMFATCLPMTRNQGDFSKSILDISLSALSSVSEGVQSEAFIRVTRALLEVVRVELSDGSPSSKEWLIGAATNLVCMTLDSSVESEIKMAALDVTKECIVRHWRWFFPADTAQARLGANSLSSDPEKEEKFLGLMRSLIGALDTVDTTAYRSTLEALQYAQTSRRLFERPILHSSGALEALIIQFLRISLANRHPTLLEENASFLHSLAIAAPYSVFLERYLPQSLTQSIPLSRPQIQAAMENLPPATKSPPDLNEFSRAYSRFRDDIEYYLNLDRPLLG